MLYYEPRFDVFTCAGFAYFTTVTLVQTKLHAVEKARQLARETLATVTAKVRIDGFVGLETAVMDDPAPTPAGMTNSSAFCGTSASASRSRWPSRI